jgi:hypothetical protein
MPLCKGAWLPADASDDADACAPCAVPHGSAPSLLLTRERAELTVARCPLTRNNAELRKGLNIIDGTVVHPAVTADYPIYPYEDVDSFLSRKKQVCAALCMREQMKPWRC